MPHCSHFRLRSASSEAKIPTVRDASPISSASSDSDSSDEEESNSEESGSESQKNDGEENELKSRKPKVERMEVDKKVDAGKKVMLCLIIPRSI